MRRTLIVGAVTMAVGLASVPMATAITFGEPDENRHPNAGAMLADFGGEVVPFCSGSLIASDVFLTAAHCIVGVEQIAEEEGVEPEFLVSFDEELGEFPDGVFDIQGFDLAPGVELISGTPFFDERFGTAGASQPFDIAVILLDTEPGIQPVDLPTEGFLSGSRHSTTSRARRSRPSDTEPSEMISPEASRTSSTRRSPDSSPRSRRSTFRSNGCCSA